MKLIINADFIIEYPNHTCCTTPQFNGMSNALKHATHSCAIWPGLNQAHEENTREEWMCRIIHFHAKFDQAERFKGLLCTASTLHFTQNEVQLSTRCRNKASLSRTTVKGRRLARAMVSPKSHLTEAALICLDDLNEELVSPYRTLCSVDSHAVDRVSNSRASKV